MIYFIDHRQQHHLKLKILFLSNSIKSLSHYVSISYRTPFSFFFFRPLYLSTRCLCFFDLSEPRSALNLLLPTFQLVSEFLLFVISVTVSNAKFSLQKTLISFNKIPALGRKLVTEYEIEFTSRKN